MASRRGMAAYMETADEESGRVLTGTRVAASAAASPIKEKANSKKSRRSGSTSPIVYGQTDSDSTILSPRKRDKEPRSRPKEKDRDRMERERERERERDHDREREHRRSSAKKHSSTRPPTKPSRAPPVVHAYPRKPQESEYYGVQPMGPPSNQRFRSNTSSHSQYAGGVPITGGGAGRSLSYHGKPQSFPHAHPPQSNPGFYSQLSTSPYAPPISSYPQGYGSSYGSSYGGPPSALAHHPSLPPPSPVDSSGYLEGPGHEHLKQRFQSGRPASAIGFRQSHRTSYYDDYENEDDAPPITRRPSMKGAKEYRDLQDRASMPPPAPPRPKSTRPGMLRPPPPPPPPPQTHKTRGYDEKSRGYDEKSRAYDIQSRAYDTQSRAYDDRSRAYDDESFDGDEGMYRDVGHRRAAELSSSQPRSRRMSMAHGGGVALQLRERSTGPSRSRPTSMYDVDDLDYDYGYGDKVHEQLVKAGAYQNSVSGGLTQALTKDALQKATKRSQGGSSRSTRSSSHDDESDWRHSATTRTTRSGVGEEDFTIKVTGQAVVEVSGATIQCQDGSAISISSRPPPPQARLSDSDKGSIAYDDRKSRVVERIPYRTRAMSQSGHSLARTRAVYDSYDRDDDHDWC